MTLRLRWMLWKIGIRVCDVIGNPVDAAILRVPFLAERTGACVILHGSNVLAQVPESWRRAAGWGLVVKDP